ncbi:MAG: glycosyltransferase family 4 protein [Armatimonadota bacterium]
MRIAIKATNIGGDGIGYYTRTLVEGLVAVQSHHQFLLLTDCPELMGATEGRPHFQTICLSDYSPRWEEFVLPNWLDEHGVDLYHNPSFSLPVVKTCRYLTTVHDCIPVLFPDLVGADFTRYFAFHAPRWFRVADHLLCNSEHTAHDLTHLYGVAPEDMSVVYHTGNASMRQSDSAQVARTREMFGLDRPFILAVGRVELRKNVLALLQAHAILSRRENEPPLLVFAGSRVSNAHDPEGLLPQVGRHGDVLVTGHVTEEELAALYSCAAVFCFPTFYEGFGRPLLEAMQCGTPVVTTRVSSLPEVGGNACLYVSPYDPQELAQALYRVLTDATLRAEMIAKGKARANEFTVERMARETLAVYEKVASAGVGRSSRARRRLVRKEAIA